MTDTAPICRISLTPCEHETRCRECVWFDRAMDVFHAACKVERLRPEHTFTATDKQRRELTSEIVQSIYCAVNHFEHLRRMERK